MTTNKRGRLAGAAPFRMSGIAIRQAATLSPSAPALEPTT